MVYMFLADGFEEVEALCPLDLMRRAGIAVTTVGVNKKEIVGAHNITVIADVTTDDFKFADDAEGVFLPGGMPGTLNLAACPVVIDAVKTAYEYNKLVAAICAAPSILGDLGLLVGKEAICYPGFEENLTGAIISEKKVVTDGNVITAAGMGVAYEMGITIIAYLLSDEKADEIRRVTIHA